MPSNVYVFPRPQHVEDSVITLDEDALFQRFRRLPRRAKLVLAGLIDDLAKASAR